MIEVPQESAFRCRGFTLMELSVAVAVVTILTAIGIPAYDRMKNQARSTACVQKLRHLGNCLNLYATDHGMKLPVMAAARNDKSEEVPVLDTVLAEYVSDETYFQCPADKTGLWEKTGTSYFWNSTVNGQHLGHLDFLGLTRNDVGIPLVSDKENFHKNVGDEVNVLYADGHVLRELQFVVDN
jgi:prepilin-type N-terminal cleavage/methylation domain-containing protein/prepilin-type processing-associated H-X9-DG protein